MKHAGLLALALCLLIPASAEARKRCRGGEAAAPVEIGAPESDPVSGLHWARGNDSSWVHEGSSSWHDDANHSWHHDGIEDVAAPAPVVPVAYDPNEANGWVHETDYGWWAAVETDEATEVEDEAPEVENEDDRFAAEEPDCTVSKDRNECVVLANQVATYRFRLGLASDREDELWAENLELTIERLESRAEFMGCPWAIEPTIGEQIMATLSKVIEAGIVAARVYSMFSRAGLL